MKSHKGNLIIVIRILISICNKGYFFKKIHKRRLFSLLHIRSYLISKFINIIKSCSCFVSTFSSKLCLITGLLHDLVNIKLSFRTVSDKGHVPPEDIPELLKCTNQFSKAFKLFRSPSKSFYMYITCAVIIHGKT